MFYGDMADKSKVIRIPDIAPIGFENLLRYAYTGTIIIKIIILLVYILAFSIVILI